MQAMISIFDVDQPKIRHSAVGSPPLEHVHLLWIGAPSAAVNLELTDGTVAQLEAAIARWREAVAREAASVA